VYRAFQIAAAASACLCIRSRHPARVSPDYRRRAVLGLPAGIADMVSLIKCLLRATAGASNKERTFPEPFLVYITASDQEREESTEDSASIAR